MKAILLGLWLLPVASAALPPPNLPEPLTLDAALAFINDYDNALIKQQKSNQQYAKAEHELAQASDDLDIYLSSRLRWVDPPGLSADQSHDDFTMRLFVDKPLLDFGRTQAASQATEKALAAAQLQLIAVQQQQRLQVMENFFNVLLADLQYRVSNEAMAVAFIHFDRAKDRHQQGQRSDLQLAQAQAAYQEVLQKRGRHERQQRLTRVRLAQSLGVPEQVPSELTEPDLKQNQQILPDIEMLTQQALDANPELNMLREQIIAAQYRVDAERAEKNPLLLGRMEANYWGRKLGSRDPFRIGFELEVPIYPGNRVNANIAKAQAERYQQESKLQTQMLAVREAVLNTWLQLQNLNGQRTSVEARLLWREMALDEARTLYDMEVNSDLGNSLVKQTEAELFAKRTEYDIALQWAKLDALLGKTPGEKKQTPDESAIQENP
ncbi:TolC family protein [Candidatus Venteria ishoeyi]|uniref:Outer membrane efflux protein n=1 Tax=Candidatus Venteria ishoeyi TaxID=1899563 RepID=A0A1H6FF13_9GAMM|nr:TolC family protein [Candidatus Venteria ishoeyi]SEH07625.1 Outer membrane efflux protein [Candidatus Venteria ishoeyi]